MPSWGMCPGVFLHAHEPDTFLNIIKVSPEKTEDRQEAQSAAGWPAEPRSRTREQGPGRKMEGAGGLQGLPKGRQRRLC